MAGLRPTQRLVLAALFAGVAFAACGGSSAVDEGQPPLRADGLSGAPLPAAAGVRQRFEPERLNPTYGAFPSLDRPRVVGPAQAPWMEPQTLVLGAQQHGQARAYPLFMMALHHVVNDELGGLPYLVTF